MNNVGNHKIDNKCQFSSDIFAVVTSEPNDRGWRIAIYCDESVPLFGPSLPCPPVFEDPYNFREFLLVKLINGEKATFDTPTFSRKRERTLDTLLRDMYQEHSQDARGNVSSVRENFNAFSLTKMISSKFLRFSPIFSDFL